MAEPEGSSRTGASARTSTQAAALNVPNQQGEKHLVRDYHPERMALLRTDASWRRPHSDQNISGLLYWILKDPNLYSLEDCKNSTDAS